MSTLDEITAAHMQYFNSVWKRSRGMRKRTRLKSGKVGLPIMAEKVITRAYGRSGRVAIRLLEIEMVIQ